MKKVLFIAICILGIVCLSSCRSTSKPCGLADQINHQNTEQQKDFM